ncbi:UDP-N-acetylglucosamine 1-carboxyvinyltransferase [Thiomicrospira cyclica]|uniref:UDP-N-acetylglucosamine 1-carboxyvinyltransferase n=1 Tax=Thiomicrospira cyclica (strain DSM 14477 / JCM 11371 / ALM1) TaxID=717773 RepID=F6DBE2_THICA|nr:UDP-N-acetylglucosamine 1-carboxyvinyltransferase [Thiomicrospira cyclica]AEG31250.1 UDP-N-acetylglucosamine 1-carboxyvinyltransferase [Thiomicrospira cyclica ALM1]
MERLVITGGAKLSGEVEVSGSKNAALPILMGCVLAKSPVTLSNIPHLKDVTTSLQLLATLGAQIMIDERMNITVDASELKDFTAPFALVKSMRASILVMGPLLARFGEAHVALPGGCAIGSRPVDIHIKGMEAMGADIRIEDGFIHAKAKRLQGADILMDKVTVTGTENLLMAAVLAEGVTHLRNAACEPEVTDLAIFLTKMGAKITGIGTDHLVIKGVDELNGVDYRVIPDRIEAGTYLAAAAVTGSTITVSNVEPVHLKAVLAKFIEAGCDISTSERSIKIDCRDRQLNPVNVETQPYPGFPTDMQAQFLVMNLLASGPGAIRETIFENRFMHVSELTKMGAHIKVEGNLAVTPGQDRLSGVTVKATDLRASACLILAALVAEGETFVEQIYHIDRGYELIEEKFHRLGANIQRLSH